MREKTWREVDRRYKQAFHRRRNMNTDGLNIRRLILFIWEIQSKSHNKKTFDNHQIGKSVKGWTTSSPGEDMKQHNSYAAGSITI